MAGSTVAAHSQLCPSSFAAEAAFHPHARYLASVAERGCDTGYCAGSKLRHCDNHPSAYEHSDIIDADVAASLQLGHVIDVTTLYESQGPVPLGMLVSPIAVVLHPSKKPRVCWDGTFGAGTNTNNFCDPTRLPHSRLHSPTDLANSIVRMQEARPSDPVLIQVYDFKSAYKFIPVRAEDWYTMGFGWRGRLYWWIVSPFGHRTSSNAMCAASDIITTKLRREGTPSHPYVDDVGALMYASSAAVADPAVRATISSFGFVVAEAKLLAAGPPATSKEWTGFLFDSEKRSISIPQAKLSQVCASIDLALGAGRLAPREGHRLWSQLLFISRAVPALAPFTVALRQWVQLSGGTRCNTVLPLGADAITDLSFWREVVDLYNGTSMLPATVTAPTATVRCDSCTTGYGGISLPDERYLYGTWGPESGEADAHINFKEAATAFAIASDAAESGHTHVHVISDNTAAIAAINRMKSISPDLLPIVRALARLALRGVHVSASYINTLQNTLPDTMSRHNMDLLFTLYPAAVPIRMPPQWASSLRHSPSLWATASRPSLTSPGTARGVGSAPATASSL